MREASARAVLRGVSFALVAGASTVANAGGFALREQSAYGQGTSYAGVASGGSLSSMFWNPATMTQQEGIQFEVSVAGIFPYSANAAGAGSSLAAFGGTRDTLSDVLAPSGYASWQINGRTWIGLSANAPFGLSETFPDVWAGRNYGESSRLITYELTPDAAFKVNDWMSVGAGLQVQHASTHIGTGLGATPGALASIQGEDWSVGFTAGLTVIPSPDIHVGLGWRSGIDQSVDGTLALPPGVVFSQPFSTPGPVHSTLNLPDVLSLGARMTLNSDWTVMGTFEWSRWSRIGTSRVLQPSGAPALIGTAPVLLPFQFDDGFYYSAGAEFRLTPTIALRSGIGFEQSPVTDRVRMPLVPDSDRIFLSVGASAALAEELRLDFAYSHLFLDDSPITISALSGNPWFNPLAPIAYVGTTSAHIDLISVGLSYRWN